MFLRRSLAQDKYIIVVGTLNECVSETKYLKYQQNIEGNSSFRM